MKLQFKSGVTSSCAKCDSVIPRSTKRFVDGGIHYCFNCKPKPVAKKTFIERLTLWLMK